MIDVGINVKQLADQRGSKASSSPTSSAFEHPSFELGTYQVVGDVAFEEVSQVRGETCR